MKTEKIDAIFEALRNLNDEQFVEVYNRFCELKGWQEMKLVENTKENFQMLIDAGGEAVNYDPKHKYVYCENLRGRIRSTNFFFDAISNFYDEIAFHIYNFYEDYKDVFSITTYRLQLNTPNGAVKYNEIYYDLEDAVEAALDEMERLEKKYSDFDKQFEAEKQKNLMFNDEWAFENACFDLELCKYNGDEIEEFIPDEFDGIRNSKEFIEKFETNGWAVSKKSFWHEGVLY